MQGSSRHNDANPQGVIVSVMSKGLDKINPESWLTEESVGACKSYFCYKCNCDVTNVNIGEEIRCPRCGDSFLEEKLSKDFADVSSLQTKGKFLEAK